MDRTRSKYPSKYRMSYATQGRAASHSHAVKPGLSVHTYAEPTSSLSDDKDEDQDGESASTVSSPYRAMPAYSNFRYAPQTINSEDDTITSPNYSSGCNQLFSLAIPTSYIPARPHSSRYSQGLTQEITMPHSTSNYATAGPSLGSYANRSESATSTSLCASQAINSEYDTITSPNYSPGYNQLFSLAIPNSCIPARPPSLYLLEQERAASSTDSLASSTDSLVHQDPGTSNQWQSSAKREYNRSQISITSSTLIGSPLPPYPASGPPPSPPPTAFSDSPLRLRAKRKCLPIILAGTLTEHACADTGSEVNCITYAYAKFLGASIKKVRTVFKLPLRGESLNSCGKTLIPCKFPKRPHMTQSYEFFVFKKLLSDVLMGRQFLRATETLDRYQSRLVDIPDEPQHQAIVRSTGESGEEVWCTLDGYPHWSIPDTGSEINLMSSSFVEQLGYYNGIGWKGFRKMNGFVVHWANGSETNVRGKVEIAVSFSKLETVVHRLINSLEETHLTAQADTRLPSPDAGFIETFYVLDGLRGHVILGETLLNTVNAYQNHSANFRPTKGCDDSCIAIGRRKKDGEHNRRAGSSILATSRLLSEEQRLWDELCVEDDRHQEEAERILDLIRNRQINAAEEQDLKLRNDEKKLIFYRNRRELINRYWHGHFEKLFPSERHQ